MVAPDPFGQRGLVDRMVRPAHEIVQDVVLLAQQLHLAARDLHAAAVGPQADIARIEALPAVVAVPPQHAAYAGAQFGQMERLGQVVVGSQLQPADLVVERVARRDDDDPRTQSAALELLEQFQPAAVRQHDVQQDAVVVVGCDLVEPRGVIGRLLDHVLLPAQRLRHDLPKGGFVLDDQNLHNPIQLSFPARRRVSGAGPGRSYAPNPKGNRNRPARQAGTHTITYSSGCSRTTRNPSLRYNRTAGFAFCTESETAG